MRDRSVSQYVFGDFVLEPQQERLFRLESQRVELAGKPLQVLTLLIEKRGTLISREELLQEIWDGGLSVTDDVITEAVSRIRQALDPGKRENRDRYIQTVVGKGYRFVAQVEVRAEPLTRNAADLSGTRRASSFWRVASLACCLAIALALAVISHFRAKTGSSREKAYQSAVSLESTGNDTLALRMLATIPETDPMFSIARLRAAWLSYQADKNDDAKKLLASIAESPSSKQLRSSTRFKIEGLEDLLDNQVDNAFEKFQLASAADPSDIEALIYAAEVAISEARPKAAESVLATCLRLDSFNPFCGFQRIDMLAEENKPDAAITEYERMRKSSSYPWLEEPAGYAELARGNVSGAMKHFEALANLGRNLSPIHFMAAQDGFASTDEFAGKLVEAHAELQTALDQSDSEYEKADYLLLMAESDALHGNTRRAIAEVHDASLRSNSAEFVIAIARIEAEVGDYTEANDFLAREKADSSGLGARYAATMPFVDGIRSLKNRDFNDAAKQLARSFRIDQDPATAYFLAESEMGAANWQAAINALDEVGSKKAQVLSDNSPSLIPLAEYQLSECFAHLGKSADSEQHLAVARSIWQDADPALKEKVRSR